MKPTKKRTLGILGLPHPDSDDDPDYRPSNRGDNSDASPRSPPPRSKAAKVQTRKQHWDNLGAKQRSRTQSRALPARPEAVTARQSEASGCLAFGSSAGSSELPPPSTHIAKHQNRGSGTEVSRCDALQEPLNCHAEASAAAGLEDIDVPLAVRRWALLQRRASNNQSGRTPVLQQAPAVSGSLQTQSYDWSRLPAELLSHVFERVCSKGAIPGAAALPCVCRHWRDVAHGPAHSLLWQVVDLSLPGCKPDDGAIQRLVFAGRWNGLRSLTLTGCSRVGDASLLLVGQTCRQLTELDLSGCQHLRQAPLEAAVRCMTALKVLNMSNTVTKPAWGGFDKVIACSYVVLSFSSILEQSSSAVADCIRIEWIVRMETGNAKMESCYFQFQLLCHDRFSQFVLNRREDSVRCRLSK